MKYVRNVEPHYGLRKLSIGVASVLLGMSIYGVVGHADSEVGSLKPVDNSKNVNVNQNMNGSNLNGNDQVVLQSKDVGNSVPSAANSEGGGTENVESNNNFLAVSSDQQFRQNNLVDVNDNRNTDFNISADSVNQHFVGLQSSLVQSSESKVAAANVQVSLVNHYLDLTHQPGYAWYLETRTSFDLNLDKVSLGQSVDLGRIHQSSDTGRYMTIAMPTARQPVLFNSQNIGYLTYDESDWLSTPDTVYSFVLTKKPDNAMGLIHLSVDIPGALFVNQDHPCNFRGVKLSHNSLSFINNLGATTSSVNYIIKQQDNFVRYDQESFDGIKNALYSMSKNYFAFANTSGAGSSNLVLTFTYPELNLDDVASTLHNNNLTKPISLLNQGYLLAGHVHLQNGGTVFSNSRDQTAKAGAGVYGITGSMAFGVDSDGRYVDSWGATAGHGYYNGNALLSDVIAPTGLSLQEMKDRIDSSRNVIMISQQSDGSLLYLANFLPSFFDANPSLSEAGSTIDGYKQVNADSNPDKAYDNSLSVLHNVFHNRLTQLAIWQPITVADPTVVNTLIVDTLDPNTGQVISTSTSKFSPNAYLSKGQAAVKLHVIDSSGVALQQVKSFTDWPNQNKHASLSIPSITGYELVSNPQSILSALHLSGTAISSAQQVDYPAENTIADYYIVLQPKVESANVQIVDADESNKVLATGTVSGRFGEQIVSSADIQSKLDSLLHTGHYVLAANDFDGGIDYKDGANTVTIGLKHKLDSTQRHYRVIEDLPDGTKKVIIDVEATLYKDAAVPYYQTHGAYTPGNSKLLKQNEFNLLIGQDYGELFTFDDHFMSSIDHVIGYDYHILDAMGAYDNGVRIWDNKPKKTVDLDLFMGQDPSLPGGSAVDPLSSRDFHIIYTKKQYPVTINYYDTTGKQISSLTTTHTYLDQVDANATAPAGYVLLSGQPTKLTVGWDHNELDLLVAPAITKTPESKTVTRTITGDNGQVLTIQRVNFHRETITNNIDHSVTHTAWVADGPSEFAAYVPALQAGYVADPIEAQVVTGDSENSTVKVRYQSVNLRPMPKYVDINGVSYDTLPVGYEVVSGQDTSKDGLLIIKKPQNIQPTPIQYVTRTVTVIMPNGQKRYIRQKARKGTKFLKVHLPRLRGYAMTITGGSVDAMAADSDQNVTVVFAK